MKTFFLSYSLKKLPKGCISCIKGEKLVLFISGICSRNCSYCSLSNKRKNKDIIYANERICLTPLDAIKEAIESNAKGAGITGGDPLLYLNRTIMYAKALKKEFGPTFHIHIYLPTKLVTNDKLKKLSKYIDEVRFHPEFLCNPEPTIIKKDIEKIKNVSSYFKKDNIGIELPMIPNKYSDILKFILKIKDHIGFINLNELELSETNFDKFTKTYQFNDTGYVVSNSKHSGIKLLKELKKLKINKNVHFCTADLKNQYQYKNRLKKHKIFPYGKKTKEGTVQYLVIYPQKENIIELYKKIKKYKPFQDKEKNRLILSNKSANLLLKKYKIYLIEEFPTFDRIEVDSRSLS